MLHSAKRICCQVLRIDPIRNATISVDHRLEDLDMKYLCDQKNYDEVCQNIKRRKGPGDIRAVLTTNESLKNASPAEKPKLMEALLREALKIPNKSHPDTFALSCEPKTVREIGSFSEANFNMKTFEKLAKNLNLTRTDNLTNLTGDRSYYLIDHLAELEQACIEYAIDLLLKLGFNFISVPDILPRQIIEACGMNTMGDRTQVYSLDEDVHGKDLCLSGTAEMGIAGYLCNTSLLLDQLPMRLAAVSRCFRAETSKIAEEKGLYRVHAFTKVEMFGVCRSEESDSMLSDLVGVGERLFSSLGLRLRTLEMPPEELGAQAHRKFDIEAWLPGRRRWAELSSSSNCTDYQSRRLNVKVVGSASSSATYPHTLNGTAAAIPRLVMALVETYQREDGTIAVPEPLHRFLNFKNISKAKLPPVTAYKGRSFYP